MIDFDDNPNSSLDDSQPRSEDERLVREALDHMAPNTDPFGGRRIPGPGLPAMMPQQGPQQGRPQGVPPGRNGPGRSGPGRNASEAPAGSASFRRPNPAEAAPVGSAQFSRPSLPAGAIGEASFRFRCGGCDESITVQERFIGRRGQCPNCLAEFIIPGPKRDITSTQRASVVPKELFRPPGEEEAQQAVQAAAKPSMGRSGRASRSQTSASKRKKTGKERRRAPRVDVKDALVRFSPDDYPRSGSLHDAHGLEDLSLTGMRFVGPGHDLEVGDAVFCALDIPAFPEPIRVKAQVRRKSRLKNDRGYSTGVRFVQSGGDAETKVRRLIENTNLRSVRRR